VTGEDIKRDPLTTHCNNLQFAPSGVIFDEYATDRICMNMLGRPNVTSMFNLFGKKENVI